MKIDPGYLYFVVSFLRFVQQVLDTVLGLLLGYKTKTGWEKDRKISGENYEKSAQVVNIWFKGAYTVACTHQLDNFLYGHEEYVSPRYVLEFDNITLHGCTATHVFFCVTDKSENVYDLQKNPFVFIAHYLLSKKLVIMPHSAFNRLASEMERDVDDSNTILLGMSGRCGSTLLCQMLGKLPKTLVMSEPWAIVHAHEWYVKGMFKEEDYEQLVKSLILLQIKPSKTVKYERVVYKVTLMCTPLFPILHKMFPKMPKLFNTRHIRYSLESFNKFFQSGLFGLFEKYQRKPFWYWNVAFDYKNEPLQILRKDLMHIKETLTKDEDNAFMVGGSVDSFLQYKHLFLDCILYEDLIQNTEDVTKRMFNRLGIGEEFVPVALTALKKHSQNNMFTQDGCTGISKQGLKAVDRALEKMGSPLRIHMSMEELQKLIKI